MENIRWISVVDAGHRSSYLQKLNCAAYCPGNLEAVISPNIDFRTSFVSSIIIFQIYTESLLHVQLSLLRT